MIYFAQCEYWGPIKIGYVGSEESMKARLAGLQVGNPMMVRITRTMEGTRADEADLLRRFRYLRIRGEWHWAAEPLASFARANVTPSYDEVLAIAQERI